VNTGSHTEAIATGLIPRSNRDTFAAARLRIDNPR
jgi:hypothetical protein